MRRAAASSIVVALAAAVIFVVGASAGCTSETIVLATVPENDDGGRPAPTRCVNAQDCPDGWFCDKHDCEDIAGECAPVPAFCDADEAPVCGCDGVTYFNDCLRRASAQPAGSQGECGARAVTCSSSSASSCPNGATCALLLGFGAPCGGDVRGTCWRVPAVCGNADRVSPDRWDACEGTGARCLDTCSAIQAGGPHVRSDQCM